MLTVPGFTRVHRFPSYLSKDRPGMMSTGAVEHLCLEHKYISVGISVTGSEQRLYQVMDVLLDNALKYSVPGGMVSVDLTSNGRTCILSVASPGEPISGEDLKNIFKRFYRADKA